MERFESKVIRVPPSIESIKIEQMAIFGWSLQNRQDVIEPIWASSTITHTDEYEDEAETDIQSTHHVALHFVRPLSLPHLEEIKQLEFEYFQLESSQPQRPQTQENTGCGIVCFGLGSIILGIVLLVGAVGRDGWEKFWLILFGILFLAFGVFLLSPIGSNKEKVKKERDEYIRKRSEWRQNREELEQRAKRLSEN